ncbi:hypothetical protein Tco_0149936 [Tanacetum coccineum]
MFIYNHRDHLGKIDEKDDDGFFIGYSLVAKAFRVFNIRRQEMEETYHVTFSEDDEAVTQTNTKGDEINFNENISFPDDEFLVPRIKIPQSFGKDDYFPYVLTFDPLSKNNITIPDPITPTIHDTNSPNESPEFSIADDHPNHQEPDEFEPAKINSVTFDSQHITINDKPISEAEPSLTIISPSAKAGVTTRSKLRDFEAASAHECLYVNFLLKIEPKKLVEALEEEGWVIAMQEELNHFERNKV